MNDLTAALRALRDEVGDAHATLRELQRTLDRIERSLAILVAPPRRASK